MPRCQPSVNGHQQAENSVPATHQRSARAQVARRRVDSEGGSDAVALAAPAAVPAEVVNGL